MSSSGKKRRAKRDVARLEGDALVVAHDAKLPDVCLKCGSHSGITKRPTTFYWTPIWARYLVFLVVGVVIALLVRKEADLAVPLCAPCRARWEAARHATVASVAGIVSAIAVVRFTRSAPMLGLVGVAVVAAVVVAVRFKRPRTLQAERIDAEHRIHLRGFAPSAARELTAASHLVER